MTVIPNKVSLYSLYGMNLVVFDNIDEKMVEVILDNTEQIDIENDVNIID